MDAVEAARSGHPGMPMGMADIAEVLWNDYLRHNPANPHWCDRDRFVLSNGHGSMLIYALAHLSGYPLEIDEIRQFRQLGQRTAGHPERDLDIAIETTTGPLGQGLANAVGMALAEKVLAETFNRPGGTIVDHYTYVFMGDGCLMEGISHEACSLAGTLGLGKLVGVYDDNSVSHRRPDGGLVHGRYTGSVPGLWLARGGGCRRARSRGGDFRNRGRPSRDGSTIADLLQDPDRLGCAQQAGHGRHPRRTTGTRRSRRHANGDWLGIRALRGARGNPQRLECPNQGRSAGSRVASPFRRLLGAMARPGERIPASSPGRPPGELGAISPMPRSGRSLPKPGIWPPARLHFEHWRPLPPICPN